jgi:hypothetical protein
LAKVDIRPPIRVDGRHSTVDLSRPEIQDYMSNDDFSQSHLSSGLVARFAAPSGLSANRSATCKAAENDCLERRNSIRPCVPSHVAYKAERGGNELFWSPWKNVSTLARAAPKPRGNGVSASIRWRRA